MRHRKRHEPVVVAHELVPRPELLQLELVGELPENPAQRLEQVGQPRRPVDRDGHLATAQGEGLEHPRQAEVVVGVVMREKDLPQLDEADVGLQQLPLRALRAVEQKPFAAPAQ